MFGSGKHAIRVDEYEEKGISTVRAELPGIDPGKDVEITVDHGVLTVAAPAGPVAGHPKKLQIGKSA